MQQATQTTIHNVTQKTKHSLSAAAAYDQLCQEAEEKGQTVKQWVAHLRNQLTEYQKEFMALDRQLATGFYKQQQEREAKVERYDLLKTETVRLSFIVSRYSEHYERLRTQKAADYENQKKKHSATKQPKKESTPPVTIQEPVSDDWEDAAELLLNQ